MCIRDSHLTQCKTRMMNILGKEIQKGEPKMEYSIVSYDDGYATDRINEALKPFVTDRFAFSARVDLLTHETLWELKCTGEITTEHMIQTVIYAWIMRTINPTSSKEVKIFNIRLGIVLKLEASIEQLTTIVVSILKGKYERAPPSTEADFLSECKKIV